MDKKNKKIVIKWGIIFTATILLFATPLLVLNSAFAQGQETCPASGDWVKVDGLTGTTYTYTAPAGKLIVETCYKAATNVIFNIINPPKKSVTIISEVGFDLSHASFRLIDEVTPTPTQTKTFTPTPTDEFTPTPTDEFTPTPTDEFTPTPTDEFTPTPTDEFTPTPTDEFTPTPTDEFTPTPTNELTPTPIITNTPTFTPTPTEEDVLPLLIEGVCSNNLASIIVSQVDDITITWSVVNDNDQDIPFNWTANNGQSGSGTAPANGNMNFTTDIDGNSVTIEYSLRNEPLQELASIEPCEPQQETEEPTPTPTPIDEPTQEPEVSVDPQPDQPAGGRRPSVVKTLAPILLGLSSLAIISTIVLKSKNKPLPDK
jgi:hypothetical protein